MGSLVKRCVNCRGNLKDGVKGVQCERCQKNEQKYGKPTTCRYCQLRAAFVDQKCVHCAHSERRFGAPCACANCKLKSAFTRPSNKTKGKSVLCRLCVLTAQGNNVKSLAGVPVPSADSKGSKDSEKKPQKRRREETENKRTSTDSAVKVVKNGPLGIDGDNVLIVHQLRDQIAKLHSTIIEKEQTILNKDKEIASLRAELSGAERKYREKVDRLNKEKEDALQATHDKYRSLKMKK